MMWYWGNGNGMGWGWGGWLVSGLLMIVFWGLVIWGVITLVRHLTSLERQAPPGMRVHSPQSTPEQILAERFARGEIDVDEYKRRLAVLQSVPGAGAAGQPPDIGPDRRTVA